MSDKKARKAPRASVAAGRLVIDGNAASMVGTSSYRKKTLVRAVKMPSDFAVITVDGNDVLGKAGDYLCEGPGGATDRYPCAADIFEATYELAVEITKGSSIPLQG